VHLAGDVELAQRLPAGAADLIIGGHTHQALNPGGLEADNVVNGIPIVQAGSQGQYLGEVTLTLSRVAGNGSSLQTAVAVTDARLTQTADLPEDELFEQTYVQPLLHAVAPVFSQSLGRVASHPDLDTEAIHNDFNSGESALANFIVDGIVARCRAHGLVVDLALLDRSVVQRGLPNDGRLTFRDWFNLMPTVDTIRLCRVNGRQLLALLQDNAYRLARPDEAHTDCGFLHFSDAVRYAVLQNGRRAHTQILHSMVDGRPLAQRLDEMFTIACHSFIRSSARRWERARAGRNLPLVDMQAWRYEDTGLFLRDELLAHIRQQGGLNGPGGLRRDGRLQVYHFARRPTALTPAPA
jgi:5'-nucleotidase/5'-nucleotidase/UDP-sugar diphosphatase